MAEIKQYMMAMMPRLWLFVVVVVLLLTEGLWQNRSELVLFRLVSQALYPQHTWIEHSEGSGQAFAISRLRRNSVSSAPAVVEFDDDPEHYFSASPPAAVDYAVVLDNLRRSNPAAVMISSNLAWRDADEFAISALTKSASQFPRVIFSAGLTRLPQSSEMPEAMLRASLPVTALRGDTSALPVVNRLAIAKTVMEGGAAWGGFSFVEGITPNANQIPLMARWGDRIVFSSVILLQLAERGLTMDEMDIEMGKAIRIAECMYSIDEFGQMKMSGRSARPLRGELAHELLDSSYQLSRNGAAKSVVLMDVSQQQGSEFFAIQQSMRMALEHLQQVPMLMNRLEFPRLPLWVVWLAYVVLILGIAACVRLSKRMIFCLLWIACWLVVAVIIHRWMPLTPLVVVMMASAIKLPNQRKKAIHEKSPT